MPIRLQDFYAWFADMLHILAAIHRSLFLWVSRCRSVAATAARLGGWKRISCVDGSGRVRAQEEIHHEIWGVVAPLLDSNAKNA